MVRICLGAGGIVESFMGLVKHYEGFCSNFFGMKVRFVGIPSEISSEFRNSLESGGTSQTI